MHDATWLTSDFFIALLIGILVLANIYLLLERVVGFRSSHARKAGGVFSGAAGMLTTFILLENQDLLNSLAMEIVLALVGLVLTTIALLRRKTR